MPLVQMQCLAPFVPPPLKIQREWGVLGGVNGDLSRHGGVVGGLGEKVNGVAQQLEANLTLPQHPRHAPRVFKECSCMSACVCVPEKGGGGTTLDPPPEEQF